MNTYANGSRRSNQIQNTYGYERITDDKPAFAVNGIHKEIHEADGNEAFQMMNGHHQENGGAEEADENETEAGQEAEPSGDEEEDEDEEEEDLDRLYASPWMNEIVRLVYQLYKLALPERYWRAKGKTKPIKVYMETVHLDFSREIEVVDEKLSTQLSLVPRSKQTSLAYSNQATNGHSTQPSQAQYIFTLLDNPKVNTVDILCIGCRKASVSGNASLSVVFDMIPASRKHNNVDCQYTLMQNFAQHTPEPIFCAKPENWVKEHFPRLLEADAAMGVIPFHHPHSGKITGMFLPLDFDNKKEPRCPLAYYVKDWKEKNKQTIKYEPYPGRSKCLLLEQMDEYNFFLTHFKKDLRDSKIRVNLKTFTVKFVPSRNEVAFSCGVMLDIFYTMN